MSETRTNLGGNGSSAPSAREAESSLPARSALPTTDQPAILVVDDHRANLVALDAVLAPLGYPLVKALSGEEALKKVLEQQFALILLDVQMPRLDGFETAKLIRKHPRSDHTPIIFISAIYRDVKHVLEGYANGGVDYMVKPFEPDVLRSKAQYFLDLHLQNVRVQRQAELLRLNERTSLEQKLERRLRSLTDLMPSCLWVAQPDGKVYYTNRSWLEYSGLTSEQSKDLGLSAVHPEDRERLRMAWSNSVRNGRQLELEYRLRQRKDGAYRWHLGRGLPERDERGQIVSWVLTATDIDDLKRAQQERIELLQAERKARREAEVANRAKDEFLASVSHELRAPLNAILGWARMVRSGMVDQAKLEHALEIIERNAQAQKELIEDILDISRIITGKLRIQIRRVSYLSIVGAALDTVRPAADAKQIELVTDLDSLADEAAGDPDRLQQVVWNLLSNAIKFTAKGGQVRIGLRQVEGDVEIKVSDTGRGIRPDFLPFVFNSFQQADPVSTRTHGGLGLGLAIVRHLVELHGGRVRAESAGEGKGATFIVRLPRRLLKEDLPEPSWMLRRDSQSDDAISVQLNAVNVLFVDDQADARELVKELLELHGAKVTSVETAEQALEAMQREHFHVLLSDIGLPMIDGYELIRQIRRLPPEQGGRIPAVAVTGFARSEDSQRALAEGFQNHLSKPIEPNELVDLVATLSTAQPQ